MAKTWERQTVRPDQFLAATGLPAKGVGYHVLIVQAGTDQVLRGQSVVMLRDSHGQLDSIELACPSIDIDVLCNLTCEECTITTSGAKLNLPPGFYQKIGPIVVHRCCPEDS